MDATEIGKVVSEKRKELGLTQQELAMRAYVSRRTIIELEHGYLDICIRRLLRVLMSLGLQFELHAAAARPTEDRLREFFSDED